MRFSLFFVGVSLLFSSQLLGDELKGEVVDSNGKPISKARVDIAIASPKAGPGAFCPSCYFDCRKWTYTDSEGKFALKDLDPKLKFRLVVTAVKKQSAATKLLDPSVDNPSIILPDFPTELPPSRCLIGRVTDGDGRPVAAALVEVIGAKTAEKQRRGKVNADSAVTNELGEFHLILGDDYQTVDVSVIAEGCAGTNAHELVPGEKTHDIRVPYGASVRGQLTYKGKPRPLAHVAIVQVNTGLPSGFKNAVPATTDANGAFLFENLPIDQPYAVYGVSDSTVLGSVVPTTLVTADGDHTINDIGTIEMVHSCSLSGRVQVANGGELPSDFKLAINRHPAWELIDVNIRKDGFFSVENLPPQTYEVRIAKSNAILNDSMYAKYHVLSPKSFGLRVDTTVVDLDIRIDVAEEKDLQRPLPGKRMGRDDKGEQKLSGIVVDPSGMPVAGIRVSVRSRYDRTSLGRQVITKADGIFELRDLPDALMDIIYHDPMIKGYPVGENAISILYPGFYSPKLNQEGIRVVYDARLSVKPKSIDSVVIANEN